MGWDRFSDQMRQSKQAIETEQSEDGTAPDHQSTLPAQRARDLPLAPPGDQESWIIFALHEDDRGARFEVVGRCNVSVGRGRGDGWRVWRYSSGGPGGRVRYAGLPQSSGNFLLLGHLRRAWGIGMGRELNHICGGRMTRFFFENRFAQGRLLEF